VATDTALLKELRFRTGAGVLDCKKALEECNGDIEKAVDLLREKGIAMAAKKMGREAAEGRIFSYIHSNGKIGVLLELNCETDFVARTDEFMNLGHELTLQIAAAAPAYLSTEDVPAEDLEREKQIYRKQALDEGKPESIVDRIVEGRLRKFYEESCLLEQRWIRDPDRKIKDIVTEHIAKFGENIVVRRFVRYAIGE